MYFHLFLAVNVQPACDNDIVIALLLLIHVISNFKVSIQLLVCMTSNSHLINFGVLCVFHLVLV